MGNTVSTPQPAASANKPATPSNGAASPFLTDVKTLRDRARKHIEQGAITESYTADREQVVLGRFGPDDLHDLSGRVVLCIQLRKKIIMTGDLAVFNLLPAMGKQP